MVSFLKPLHQISFYSRMISWSKKSLSNFNKKTAPTCFSIWFDEKVSSLCKLSLIEKWPENNVLPEGEKKGMHRNECSSLMSWEMSVGYVSCKQGFTGLLVQNHQYGPLSLSAPLWVANCGGFLTDSRAGTGLQRLSYSNEKKNRTQVTSTATQ